MEAGTATFRSVLDKPLSQLTEDDISQLTREDCRKFLKDKGMRRPSWNKSQAIQQVISLKALLEPTDDDSGTGSFRRLSFASLPQTSPPRGDLVSENCVKGSGGDAKLLEPAEVPLLEKGEEASKSGSSGERLPGADINENAVTPGACATSVSIGQMTIFYCGKVNVYDEVPIDKARMIMHLAASPLLLLKDDPFNNDAVGRNSLCQSQTAIVQDSLAHQETTILPTDQPERMAEYPFQYREKLSLPRDADIEGQASRKVSVQRYLEKRKDRGRLIKSKKIAGTKTASLEIYLNHQLGSNVSNKNSSRSSTSSPTQTAMPQLSGCTTDNQLKVPVSVDLNEKDIQQI